MISLTVNQLIAADTDGNGTVNSLDATRIQQRAVGIIAQNIIGQWKFVPGSKQYKSINSNAAGEDYQAVLVGEVSGNWATAASFAGDSETEEEMPPKQVNPVNIKERLGNELSAQHSESIKQSADLQTGKSESIVSPQATVTVSLPADAKAGTGAIINIPVSIGGVPAVSSIESFDFTVFYDPAVLLPTSAVGSSAGALSGNCFVLPNSPQTGKVIVSGSCPTAITSASDGVLYNLQFTVIGSANQTSVLTFTDAADNNTTKFQFNNGEPSASITNGSFMVFAPTAASVSVAGRVTTASGRGIRNVQVTMIDTAGRERSVQTTSFGYYRFENVQSGDTVMLTAKAGRFRFARSTIVRTANESISDADFISEK